MPHLVLEYSANIDCPPDLPVLFGRLHEVLAETGGIRLQITVEIQDIRRASYFKYPAGTLTPQ